MTRRAGSRSLGQVVNERLYLGIEIGGTKLQVVLGNDHASILDRRRFSVNQAAGGAGIRNQITQALVEFLKHHRISGVGIGFGGPVDWRTGRICCSHHIEGWGDFELAKWMQTLAHVPVRVDNDANTAALAEALRGAGRQANPVFYVTLGSGVGGGLVVNGEMFHGATPGESEIGHVRLDKKGTIVEQRCSGWALDRRIREAVQSGEASLLGSLIQPGEGGETRHLRKAVAAGDALARRLLEELAEDLAFGLSHVVHLVHPEVIVLGGGVSLMGEILSQAVARHLPRFMMDAFQPGPRVRLAALGEDVVTVGALLLAKMAAENSNSLT